MGKKILVIDDDEGIVDGFQAILESEGYEVVTSSNGDIISSLTTENIPSLIILDVLLSGVDGRDICRKLKQNEKTKHIPVLMMSAAPDVKKSVMKAHADDFFTKPFEMEEVLAKAKKYIGTSE